MILGKFLVEVPRKHVHCLFPLNVKSTTEFKDIVSLGDMCDGDIGRMVTRFPDVNHWAVPSPI